MYNQIGVVTKKKKYLQLGSKEKLCGQCILSNLY